MAWLVAFDDQSEGPKGACDQTTDDERQHDEERQRTCSDEGNGQGPVGRVRAGEFWDNAQNGQIAEKQGHNEPSDSLPENSPANRNCLPIVQAHVHS